MSKKNSYEKLNKRFDKLQEKAQMMAKLFGIIDENVDDFEGETLSQSEKAKLEKAQDIAYQGSKLSKVADRIRMAKKVLTISPHCADAYCIMANAEESIPERAELFQKAMAIERRLLGEESFDLDFGFENTSASQSYVAYRQGYVKCLWSLNKYEDAIDNCKELMMLDGMDLANTRYLLLYYLLYLEKYDECAKLLNKSDYKIDDGTFWIYTRALIAFIQFGESSKSNKALKKAIKDSEFAIYYLTGAKPFPKIMPKQYSYFDNDEGLIYAAQFLPCWQKVPGAIEWIKKQSKAK